MEASNISPVTKFAVTTRDEPATPLAAAMLSIPPNDSRSKLRSLLHRRNLWLIGALFVVGLGVLVYYWEFAKPKIKYVTASVERGDVESTVVAAGIVQPINYVDVGAQTSGELKSLKVKRGDEVEKNQLLAEIDPVLAATALTSA